MTRQDVYGKYQLLAPVATGGMAEVWLARSSSIGGFEKLLAIKRLHPRLCANQGFVSLFIEEAKMSVSLNHPNIVQIFDFGRVDDNYYIAMEYVEGVDLATLAAQARDRGQPLPVDVCVYIMSRVFEGLAYAHTRRDRYGRPAGIIHRDVSPHNVLLSYEGQTKINDFGIAKAVEELARSEHGEVVGKVAYMSPELARGEVITTSSDIWGGGVMLHEILCSARLFARATDPETLEAVALLPIQPPSLVNPQVPPALDDIIMRVLDRNVLTRPSSAREVAEALSDVMRMYFPRANDFRLADAIRALWDGHPPLLTAALEAYPPAAVPRRRTDSAFDSTHPATPAEWSGSDLPAPPPDAISDTSPGSGGAHAAVDSMRAPRPTDDWAPDVWGPTSQAVPPVEPSAPGPPLHADEMAGNDPDEVARLKQLFVAGPNLWLLVDIGDSFKRLGMESRAIGAYELAAAKFAQQGLLVQAIAIHCMMLERLGPIPRVLEGVRRLPSLPGMPDAALMLELVDPADPTIDFSEYHGLFTRTGDEDEKRVDIVAPAPIFSALEPDQLERLTRLLQVRWVPSGDEIVCEGEPGHSFFWIGRGRVMVSTSNFQGQKIYLTSLADGDCFGEQSFFTGRARDATVDAMDEVLLLEIGKNELDGFVSEFPATRETLRQFYKDRIAESVLARSSLFGSLAVRDRRRLASRFSFVNFEAAGVIISEGEASDAFYAIRSGEVEVYTGDGPTKLELARLGAGEVFGEIAAMNGIARTASVRALTACELLRLEATDLRVFLEQNADVREKIEAQIEARADETVRRLTEPCD